MLAYKSQITKSLKCTFGIVLLLSNLFIAVLLPPKIYATVSNCSVAINTTAIPKGTTTDIAFTVTNNDTSSYNWIKITRPNFRFTINSGDSDNWDSQPTSSAITFASGEIAAEGTSYFTVNVTTIDSTAASANWIVQASDDGGSTIANCTGTTGLSIIDSWNFPVEQSAFLVTNLTSTTATVSWTTTRPASSQLDYGTTESYGSTLSDSDLQVVHVYDLVGLTSNTTYYYDGLSLDSSSNEYDDVGEFTTAASGGGSSTPVISNISAGSLTSSGATITWTTDIAATSIVKYGTTASYGTTSSDGSYVTSHSVTLTGLSASTTYHYQVESTSSQSQTATSGDNTFTTAASTPTPTPTPTSTPTPTPTAAAGSATNTPTPTSSPSSTSTPTPTPQASTVSPTTQPTADTTPPVVTFNTPIAPSYTTAPQLTATATDEGGVRSLEYSIDGGKNWLPIEDGKFTPQVREDGDYKIKIRATDLNGNITYSDEKTLVIDFLPPRVGGSLLSLGPQVLYPEQDGSVIAVTGYDQKVTFASIGGATGVDLVTTGENGQVFSLVKDEQTGLWKGAMGFNIPGTYKVNVRAVDGAGHKVERNYTTVTVLKAGIVKQKDDMPIEGAKVTLYYKNPNTDLWKMWDGEAFDQKNPQITNAKGEYHLYAPPGQYYLKIEASGYKTAVSNIITVDNPSPITSDFKLNSTFKIKLGPITLSLPYFFADSYEIETLSEAIESVNQNITGRKLPKIVFTAESSEKLNEKDLEGKKTLLTVISTWSPGAAEQARILDGTYDSINTRLLTVGESKAKVDLFKKRGKYTLPIFYDSEMNNVSVLQVNTVPIHYFIDSSGVVKKVMYGVLSKEEIEKEWESF